ncbi:uncharacterized protein PHALS_15371 [Plasmopara halstedii]|uniref:Uncharacterized protein n=1 Tax=Plasmopara halstedii TaxID=4781 RepID=A0A0N7L396_PLAHL|nr:uncharacterized protein PHALS_15371 [Plasmopara halstedii]CEG35259.1 hypothetical protein PHALS_15371 [Plasmopara halstedii]|eukprot:XP_024571628.1 hypothetical protein PHALS_15371 [Plasmopara halstedii]
MPLPVKNFYKVVAGGTSEKANDIHQFFCKNWSVPGHKLQICCPSDSKNNMYCIMLDTIAKM